ncbi:MAG: hypothetical protein HYT94_05165 [Parcubacteria group bacterium]|nr:hypothetical protein [Parcubacteria group bacterium]
MNILNDDIVIGVLSAVHEQTAKEIEEKLEYKYKKEFPGYELYMALHFLEKRGILIVKGKGGRKDPLKFRLIATLPPDRNIGKESDEGLIFT